MNYKKIYDNLVSSRKYRGEIKRKNDGFNKHHILPKCLGGEDIRENYVLLTFREHLLAHKLLCEIFPESKELKYAYLRMIQSSHSDRKENRYKTINGKKISYTTKDLEILREESIAYLREINLGKKLTEEHKRKLSKSHLGKKASKETRKLLSKIRKGHPTSEETRKKISISNKGKKFSKEHIEHLKESRKGWKFPEKSKYKISGKNNPRSKPVIGPDGTEYVSIRDCCKHIGVTDNTLKSWIKNKPEKGFKFK